jgi:hypothetical protein
VEPRPDIDAPLVTVIQLTLLTDVHAQLDPVVTETVPPPPVEPIVAAVGDTLYVHCAYAGRGSSRQRSARMTPQHRTIIGTLGVRTAFRDFSGRIRPPLHIPGRCRQPQDADVQDVSGAPERAHFLFWDAG